MVNSSTVNTCPLFPDELENNKLNKSYGSLNPNTGQLKLPGIFSVGTNSTLPQGVGSGTMTTVANVQMDWGDVFYSSRDEELRQKYPALQQAWDHYHNILNMCKTREDEVDED
jgi:hypothetical protein